MRKWGIAPLALILAGAVACTSSGSGGATSSPTSTLPTSASPSSTPVTSVAPTPTPTVATTGPNVRPGEKPPTYPAESLRNTSSGALAFATFWFLTLDWAYATMDTTLMSENSAPNCTDCALAISGFRQAARVGEHFSGGRLILRSSTFAPNDGRNGADQAVDVDLGEHQLRVVNALGKTLRSDTAVKSMIFRLWVRWNGHAWTAVQKGHVVR